MDYINILGTRVVNATSDEINQVFDDILSKPYEKCYPVYFLNAHGANLTFTDKAFADSLKQTDFVLNDGIGVDIAAWLQGRKFKENLNGSDLVDEGEFLAICAKKGYRIYILGAKQEVLELAIENYKKMYPGLHVAGSHNGYFGPDQDLEVVGDINKRDIDVLLVGMGNPKQELWIEKYREQLKVKLAFGYGGSIDQVAKVVPRAPKFFIRIRMEWFFRLMQEPKRLWRRYIIGNAVFLWRVILRRKGRYTAA